MLNKYILVLALFCFSANAQFSLRDPAFLASRANNTAGPCAFPSSFSDGDDYLTIASLGGIYDTNKGIFSVWIKSLDDVNSDYLLQNNIAGFFITRENTGFIRVVCTAPGGAPRLQLDSSVTITNDGYWHHIISSWDLGTPGAAYLYIDGCDVTTTTTFTDGMIDYTSDYAIGANTAGSSVFTGYMSEFYFTNVFLDITVAANRDKFYNSTTRKPVSLGADGSTPLGGQPLIYLHTAVPNWEVNSGGGGNFTEAGTGGFVDGGIINLCNDTGFECSGVFGLLTDNSTQILNDNSTEIKPDSQ